MQTNTPRRGSWLSYACVIVAVGIVLTACGGDGADGASTTTGGGTPTSTGGGASADGYPVTIQN